MDADIDGRRLSAAEARTQLAFIILAGNETTRQLLGNLLVRVATDRGLFEQLQGDRSLVERAVEESLRIDPPFPMLMRNVEQETTVFGPRMGPGASLARLEGQVLLETFPDRVAEVTAAPGWVPRKTPVFFANGPIDLPVRVVAAR